MKGAKNIEQANAWVSWINTPEGGAAYGQRLRRVLDLEGRGRPACDADQRKLLETAFPGDALKKIWWWPAQPSWFITKRTEYAKTFHVGLTAGSDGPPSPAGPSSASPLLAGLRTPGVAESRCSGRASRPSPRTPHSRDPRP